MATVDRTVEGWLAARPGSDRGRRDRLRLTPEEQRERMAGLPEVLDRMAAIENGPNEHDGDLFRALDESHPGRFHLERYY